MSHANPLQLDAIALGAGDPAVLAHLKICPQCTAALAAQQELHAEFLVDVLPRRGHRRPDLVRSRPRRKWWLMAFPALAAAAAVVLLLAWPKPADEPELGVKGGPAWQVVANRAGATFAVKDGTLLAAADRIRFVVVPDRARYLMIASIDGAGAASIYYPYDGAQSAPINAARLEVPDSIVLDAAPGPERLFALLSDQPLSADAVRAALRAIKDVRATTRLELPAKQLTLVFDK